MFDTFKTTALCGLLALTATGAIADTKVEFWHSFKGASGDVLDEIIAGFEAENPEIDIEGMYIGNYNDIVTKLQAAIPARRAPDAVIMEVTRYGLFADRGVLSDLTGYLEADPLKDDLFDFAREVGVYQGKNYIVPFNSSTPVLYVNTAIFAEAGMTEIPPLSNFSEILDAAKTVQAQLGEQGISGIAARAVRAVGAHHGK